MNSYYQKSVEIVSDYLGPAAQRFVKRQISFHLEKDPESLEKQDIKKLSEMIRAAMGMLSQDKQAVDACYKRMLNLSA